MIRVDGEELARCQDKNTIYSKIKVLSVKYVFC